jgi:signal transduction histidine kinase
LVINPAAKEMLGIRHAAPNIFDVLDTLSSKMDLRTKIEESIRTDKLTVEEQLKLDTKVLRILISPVKDADNEALGAVVLFHDITQEKAIEKMRDDFTSMMVHELRSPLTGIRSIANLLKEDKIKNEQKKYQDVNDLLDVAKLEAGKFQVMKKDTDVANVINQRIQSFASLAAENHLTLESKLGSELPIMQLDENKIGQVLNNLISNAIKFTKQGKIVVSGFVLKAGEKLTDKVSALGLNWPGLHEIDSGVDQLILAVTDTGMGIPADQMDKLFNKFTQLEQSAASEKKGTGLGLVITKGIVEAHGGHMGVFSEVNKGSTFYCSLPLAGSHAAPTTGAK